MHIILTKIHMLSYKVLPEKSVDGMILEFIPCIVFVLQLYYTFHGEARDKINWEP